jgi:hypothetical protein
MARTYYIDSEQVKIEQDWTIEKKLNERAVLDVTVIDMLALGAINLGDSFEVYQDATRIFAGVIKDIEEYEDKPNVLHYQLAITNNSALADKVRIGKTYESEAAGDIVTDFITEKLAAENVTAGTIQTGPTISKAVFNYKKVSEALDYIKDVTGLVWEINDDLELNFFDRSTNAAPWGVDDATRVYDFKRRRSMENYRNVQYTRGGNGRTDTQTDVVPSPKPDGSSRNFILPYPIAEKPTITINSTPVNSDDVGVRGFDTGKKWYFSYNSEIVTQDDSETVLTDSDTLEVTFVGLFPIFVEARDEEEITDRASKEGNSGIYESLVVEKSIDTIDGAAEYSRSLLRKYGEVADRVTFSTYTSGLEPGQLISIERTLYGIDDDFLIESVTIEPDGPDTVIYHVVALDGAAIGGWENFFRELLQAKTDYVISDNEVLIKLQAFTDNMTLTDSLTVSSAAPETRVGYAQIGYGEVA